MTRTGKIIVLVPLILVALGSALYFLPLLHHNMLYDFLDWADVKPTRESRDKAAQLVDKVLRAYRSTGNLSFKKTSDRYWWNEGTWRSRLPLRYVLHRRTSAVDAAMTPNALMADISVREKPLYTRFLDHGRYYEFKRPWNGVPGQKTDYPIEGYDRNWHLRRGGSGDTMCEVGVFLLTWIGPDSHQLRFFKRALTHGYWLGSRTVDGQRCDVVVWEERTEVEERKRWDIFYINAKGFIIVQNITRFYPHEYFADAKYEWFTIIQRYTDFSTDPIPSDTFSPSEALLEESRTWQVLGTSLGPATQAR